MRIDEATYHILNDAMHITGTDYNIRWFDKDIFDGYIDEDNLISIIEDLIYEYDALSEKKDELEQDLRDNYKPIPQEEQYEIGERDFL